MKRFALFALGLGALVVGVLLQSGTAQGQMPQASPAGKNGFRATLVGVAASDFAKSQAFYEHIMGFPVAFKFSSADGTRTNLFFQMGRNSFIEMQVAGGDVKPGLTHAHFVVDDLTATLAKLRQAGLGPQGAAAGLRTPWASKATPRTSSRRMATSTIRTASDWS
jgi:hypothetical protein